MFWGKQTWIKILALSPTSKVVCRPHFISVLVHPVFYNRIAHIVWLIGNWDSSFMVPETEKFKIKVLVDSMSNEIWFPDSRVSSCYCVSTGRRRKNSAGFFHNDGNLNCQGYVLMTSSPPKVLSPGYYHTSDKVLSYGFWGSNIQTIPLRPHLLI